jgi:hypothetical protein
MKSAMVLAVIGALVTGCASSGSQSTQGGGTNTEPSSCPSDQHFNSEGVCVADETATADIRLVPKRSTCVEFPALAKIGFFLTFRNTGTA